MTYWHDIIELLAFVQKDLDPDKRKQWDLIRKNGLTPHNAHVRLIFSAMDVIV
jgi:hypothetical protein